MKKCVCGQLVASNARTCPHCGNRFTHPLVMTLAWFFGICLVLMFVVVMFQPTQENTYPVPTAAQTQRAPTAPSSSEAAPFEAIKPKYDETAFVIKHCGRPDRDFLQKAPDTTIRHLVYRK